MPQKKTKLTIAGIAYVLFFAGAGAGVIDRDSDSKCGGEERWKIKTGTDDLAGDINTAPQVTTIAALNAIPLSATKIKDGVERQQNELQVYTIKNCFISGAILESDNDLHLVIEDGKGGHMIAEIPDPKCAEAKKSDFIDDFRKARAAFLKVQDVYNHRRFDISGVLFNDKKHPKPPTGNALNNIELHPVIKLKVVSTF